MRGESEREDNSVRNFAHRVLGYLTLRVGGVVGRVKQ